MRCVIWGDQPVIFPAAGSRSPAYPILPNVTVALNGSERLVPFRGEATPQAVVWPGRISSDPDTVPTVIRATEEAVEAGRNPYVASGHIWAQINQLAYLGSQQTSLWLHFDEDQGGTILVQLRPHPTLSGYYLSAGLADEERERMTAGATWYVS